MSASLLMLGAGKEQGIAIDIVRSMGIRVIAVDQNPNAYGFERADKGIVGDIRNVEMLVNIGKEFQVAGVFTHAVEIPQVVSQVAQRLGLSSISPEVAERATNKAKRIEWLAKHNVRVPRYCVAKGVSELESAAKKIGFPLVLKPIDNAGSRGVQLVNSIENLHRAYVNAVCYSHEGRTVLLEQKLFGPQISTESLVYRKKIYTFAFADRNYNNDEFFSPYFIENGINFPSILSPKIIEQTLQTVEKTIHVLGIENGAAKGDILIYEDEPVVLEMACRTSGGWFCGGSIPLATGVNALIPLIQISLGQHPDLTNLETKFQKGCAQRYWIPRYNGILKAVKNVDIISNMKGVGMFEHFFPFLGSALVKATNHAQRYAMVICTANHRDEAIQQANSAIESLEVEIE